MKRIAIGIMSGTSLDGIDVVLGSIEGSGIDTRVSVISSATYKYENLLVKKIKKAISNEFCTSKDICSLNYELAEAYSKCVFRLCEEADISLSNINFIASHGQTIYHITETQNGYIRSSLQLGDGSVLANLTNTTVISNFRAADIAKGGQGAPLVPYADYILFKHEALNRIMQNIGGISNATVIQKGATIDDVFAFDNGPGNMMIDHAMKVLFNQEYDDEGLVASKGVIIKPMFDEILSNDYFSLKPPKSTGRELFGSQYTNYLLEKYKSYDKNDIICTLTNITAYTIANSYINFVEEKMTIDEVIISGGGAHNKTLLHLIRYYLEKENVYILDEYGYSSDYKEALAFLILGNETLHGNPSNIINATGASEYTVLGQISRVIN